MELQEKITFWLAIWGAILSTIAIVWNILRDLKDRADIQVKVKKSDRLEAFSQIPYVDVELSNIGKRPITVTEVYYKISDQLHKVELSKELPKELSEGEPCHFDILILKGLEKVEFIAAKDVRGKSYHSVKYPFKH
jgi:hypothetical protein